MHPTCGNVGNVYSLADQVALGRTIFADSATCALRRCDGRRNDVLMILGDRPDYDVCDLTADVSRRIRNTNIGYEIVISGATVNDSLLDRYAVGRAHTHIHAHTRTEKGGACFGS